MQSDPQKDSLDLKGETCYNSVDIKPPISKDTTLVLTLAEEKFVKRLRQVGSGLFFVIMMDEEPVIVVVGGRVEALKKLL